VVVVAPTTADVVVVLADVVVGAPEPKPLVVVVAEVLGVVPVGLVARVVDVVGVMVVVVVGGRTVVVVVGGTVVVVVVVVVVGTTEYDPVLAVQVPSLWQVMTVAVLAGGYR
jgi:hypothetical protein